MKKLPIPPSKAASLLIVTDCSDAAITAFQWAIPEAQAHHLKISVLYPYRLDSLWQSDNLANSRKELDREAMRKFERVAQELLLNSRVPFDFRSEVGFLRDRIADFARKNNVSLVVLPSQMANMETFQELVGDLKIPLVIVPSPASV